MKKNNLMMACLFALQLIMLICEPASARTHHMTLLTVGEIDDQLYGSTAESYLEIKPGTGRIFLDSFPLTKLDTQISTRYANKIACDYLDMNCENMDFFYTIRADTTIVGGPSASGPLTVLTIAALKNINLNNDTIMTGTINSGGSIGPVGGIIQKAEAAQKAGFKRVLVPLFSIIAEENITSDGNNNDTLINITRTNEIFNDTERVSIIARIGMKNLTRKDENKTNITIDVIKVRNIEEAMAYFSNIPIKQNDAEIIVPEEYQKTMEGIAGSLCNRAMALKANLLLNESENNATKELLSKIDSSSRDQDHYARASYCFNLAVLLRKMNFRQISERNPAQLHAIKEKTKAAIQEFSNRLEAKNITTISELETYIIVKERLIEAEQSLLAVDNEMDSDELAYAIERYFSGVFWSEFFKIEGRPVILDQKFLEEACYKKISEAEERINYAEIYLPMIAGGPKDSIKQAYLFLKEKNYKMCLYKASFAKAESNLMLSSISIGKDQLDELSKEKISASKRMIAKEGFRGFFPIMGYSYAEYADSLRRNNDSLSSLIFSEYSLELSNIEIYFPKKTAKLPRIDLQQIFLISTVFLMGIFIGIAISWIIYSNARKIKLKRKQKRKRKS